MLYLADGLRGAVLTFHLRHQQHRPTPSNPQLPNPTQALPSPHLGPPRRRPLPCRPPDLRPCLKAGPLDILWDQRRGPAGRAVSPAGQDGWMGMGMCSLTAWSADGPCVIFLIYLSPIDEIQIVSTRYAPHLSTCLGLNGSTRRGASRMAAAKARRLGTNDRSSPSPHVQGSENGDSDVESANGKKGRSKSCCSSENYFDSRT